jgi:hypothetical protein
MSACRYGNDINETIHLKKNTKNYGVLVPCSPPELKKYYKLCDVWCLKNVTEIRKT